MEITQQHERAMKAWISAAHHPAATIELREELKVPYEEELEGFVTFAADYVNAVLLEGGYTT